MIKKTANHTYKTTFLQKQTQKSELLIITQEKSLFAHLLR